MLQVDESLFYCFRTDTSYNNTFYRKATKNFTQHFGTTSLLVRALFYALFPFSSRLCLYSLSRFIVT